MMELRIFSKNNTTILILLYNGEPRHFFDPRRPLRIQGVSFVLRRRQDAIYYPSMISGEYKSHDNSFYRNYFLLFLISTVNRLAVF